MARLETLDGMVLELSVVGWEFPFEPRFEQMDLDWMVIEINAVIEGREWTARGPYLNYTNGVFLLEWIRGDGSRQNVDWWTGDEPNIQLTRTSDMTAPIEIELASEFRPSWGSKDTRFAYSPVTTAEHWLRFADELGRELARFPQRTTAP